MSILSFYRCNIKRTQAEPSYHLFQDGSACVYNPLKITDLFNYILTIIYRSTYYIISLSTMESICQSYFLIVNNMLTVPDPFYSLAKSRMILLVFIICSQCSQCLTPAHQIIQRFFFFHKKSIFCVKFIFFYHS